MTYIKRRGTRDKQIVIKISKGDHLGDRAYFDDNIKKK